MDKLHREIEDVSPLSHGYEAYGERDSDEKFKESIKWTSPWKVLAGPVFLLWTCFEKSDETCGREREEAKEGKKRRWAMEGGLEGEWEERKALVENLEGSIHDGMEDVRGTWSSSSSQP